MRERNKERWGDRKRERGKGSVRGARERERGKSRQAGGQLERLRRAKDGHTERGNKTIEEQRKMSER